MSHVLAVAGDRQEGQQLVTSGIHRGEVAQSDGVCYGLTYVSQKDVLKFQPPTWNGTLFGNKVLADTIS